MVFGCLDDFEFDQESDSKFEKNFGIESGFKNFRTGAESENGTLATSGTELN